MAQIIVQWRDRQGEMQDKTFTDASEANFFAKNNLPKTGATQIKIINSNSFQNGRTKALADIERLQNIGEGQYKVVQRRGQFVVVKTSTLQELSEWPTAALAEKWIKENS